MAPRLAALVLAAGKGTRFPGVASKVLVTLAGRSLLERVLESARALEPERVIVVVGHGKEAVRRSLSGLNVETVDQGEPRGTGHAVLAAAPLFAGSEAWDLLVLNGDVPLLRAETLRRLLAARERRGAAAALLSAEVADPGAYGRVLRHRGGAVRAIVEARDASPGELRVREINVGAYAFQAPEVFEVLRKAGRSNAQGEVYLTDAVRLLVKQGSSVEAVRLADAREAAGVNTPAELEELERVVAGRHSLSPR